LAILAEQLLLVLAQIWVSEDFGSFQQSGLSWTIKDYLNHHAIHQDLQFHAQLLLALRPAR
jgi:hypothetical protein